MTDLGDMEDVIREFVVECRENLDQFDRDLITLERAPRDRESLTGAFRTLHNIKGTAGMLGLERLEELAHAGESLLARVRDGSLRIGSDLVTALLGVGDALRRVLRRLEDEGVEGDEGHQKLLDHLQLLVELEEQDGGGVDPGAVADPVEPGLGVEPDDALSHLDTPTPPALPAVGPARAALGAAEASVRVNVSALDAMMGRVGELVLVRNQIVELAAASPDAALLQAAQRLDVIAQELQADVMRTRMQPIADVVDRLPRLVRDLCVVCGREAVLELDGRETELDRGIIEAMRDGLTHLVRNAIDHGIEPPDERARRGKARAGRLVLRARHEAGQVVVELNDDGAGIDCGAVRRRAVERGLLSAERAARLSDAEALDLIFQPGLSTSKEVTQISGRGVGLDVVKNAVEQLGGTIDVRSQTGRGTSFKLQLPLTLAIVPALLLRCRGERYAIPQASVVEMVRIDPAGGGDGAARVETVHHTEVLRLRGRVLPLLHLERVLHPASRGGEPGAGARSPCAVVLRAGARRFGLVVDAVDDTLEIVVQPLGRQLASLPIYVGATVLGDGSTALILDVPGLARRANVDFDAAAPVGEAAPTEAPTDVATGESDVLMLLVCRNPDGGRIGLPVRLVRRIEEVSREAFELSGGRRVIRYRGEVIPVVLVEQTLPERREVARAAPPRDPEEPAGEPHLVQVIVCDHAGRSVGIAVDQVLDIVEASLSQKQPPSREGVAFTLAVGERVTEVLDLAALLDLAGIAPERDPPPAAAPPEEAEA